MNARMWAMIARHHMGEVWVAQRHAEICIAMGTPSNQAARLITIFDPVVATLTESSRNLWMMGDTRGCLDHTRRAIALAREVRHPDSLSFALLFHGWMHGYREDWEMCLRSTAEAIALGPEHGLVQTMAWNHCIHGWATAHTGKTADGLAELQGAIEDSVRIMGQIAMPHFMAMLAEVLILRGDHGRALDEIQRILTVNETSHDLYFNAELHRVAAQCHLALGEPEAAEVALQQAIETARAQGARTFELRATTALGRLWADRGEKGSAHALLQSVCEILHDAEETVDVRRARACLMEWS
jgi:predicted ATPase